MPWKPNWMPNWSPGWQPGTFNIRQLSLNNGLVAFWNLDEATGTRFDSGPNGLNLTANNSPLATTGVSAQTLTAASLVKSSVQYLNLPIAQAGALVQTASFTLTAWVKLTTAAVQAGLVTKGTIATTSTSNYSLAYVQSVNRFRATVKVVSAITITANTFGAVSTGTWYFLCLTVSAPGTASFSINNGTADTTAVGAALDSNNANDFLIGAASNGSNTVVTTTTLDGAVDAVGFWNRVLTASEISDLYNSGQGRQFPNI